MRRGTPRSGRRALHALDAGRPQRIALPDSGAPGPANIDHHHDNPRYGDIAFVRGGPAAPASWCAKWPCALGLRPSASAAAALYAGISFDTGHFHHDSTSASTFRTAAWLVDLGADVTGDLRVLYERRSEASLRLWARAVTSARSIAAGKGLLAAVTLADYAATGAGPEETEGIVDSLRSVSGVEAAALAKEQPGGAPTRVSLRSETIDVSAVAALRGGGGHRWPPASPATTAPRR